jgi:hypothetical protein
LPFLIVLWLWQWGHSMTFSLALLLFSHATNSMTSASFCDHAIALNSLPKIAITSSKITITMGFVA